MKLRTFCFSDQYLFGPCFENYLALRYRKFVKGLGWKLPHKDELERDQYDHPLSVYSIVERDNQVIAGARATPCSACWNGWTYMLKDAHLEKISSIPSGLLSVYPETADIWECTRLVLDENELSPEERTIAMKLVVYGLCKLAKGGGCEKLISLSPRVFSRYLKTLGYDAQPIGPVYRCEEDGLAYRPFAMPCDDQINQCLGEASISSNSPPGSKAHLMQSDAAA
jgi:acyl homoserine lactone synthase